MGLLDLSGYKVSNASALDPTTQDSMIDAIVAVVNALTNVNIDPAAAIAISKLAGYPADATKVLKGDGTWSTVSSSYRKTTAKVVNTTTAETDLLNGEITIGAAAMGTTGRLRIHARGDWKQNSGAAADIPRLKLKFGGATLIDVGPLGVNVAANSALRGAWEVDADIMNLGATNAQWVHFKSLFEFQNVGATGGAAPTTGEGAITTLLATAGPATDFTLALVDNNGTVDTTAPCVLALTVVNASANAGYEVTLKSAFIVVE